MKCSGARPAFAACILFLTAFVVFSGHTGVNAASWNFDFLMLVQQWGNSFCSTQKQTCSVPSGTSWFTLHGLWPNNNDTTYPSNCNSSYPFSEAQIAPIKGQLVSYWTNYFTHQTDESFWSHEWVKHGTCGTIIPALNSQLKYFSSTLKIRNLYPVAQALEHGGIVPSDTAKYSAAQVKQVLQSQMGFTPVLGCSHSSTLGSDVLVEVAFCISKYSLTAFECDQRVLSKGLQRRCDTFMFPKTKGN